MPESGKLERLRIIDSTETNETESQPKNVEAINQITEVEHVSPGSQRKKLTNKLQESLPRRINAG